MKTTNTLIVGQGIAGSMVAYMLHLQKIPFLVIDNGVKNSASRIAAGMFTPVTGRRKTIQPLALQQIPFAIDVYEKIEKLFGISFLHRSNVYQVYNSESEQHQWEQRSLTPEYDKFIGTQPEPISFLKQPFGACEINFSGWVDCGSMINAFAGWLNRKEALLRQAFQYDGLVIHENEMEYNGLLFKNIIFCEGYRAADNPFFNQKIIPCKGDMLTVKYNSAMTEKIIKKNSIYLIETAEDFYKAGSTYEWNNNDEQPRETGRQLLKAQLDELLENKYDIVDHQSAIRPTTQNRDVIAQQHPLHKGMYMLNGLGTKGILQGPWWASHLAKQIEASNYQHLSKES